MAPKPCAEPGTAAGRTPGGPAKSSSSWRRRSSREPDNADTWADEARRAPRAPPRRPLTDVGRGVRNRQQLARRTVHRAISTSTSPSASAWLRASTSCSGTVVIMFGPPRLQVAARVRRPSKTLRRAAARLHSDLTSMSSVGHVGPVAAGRRRGAACRAAPSPNPTVLLANRIAGQREGHTASGEAPRRNGLTASRPNRSTPCGGRWSAARPGRRCRVRASDGAQGGDERLLARCILGVGRPD